MKRLPSVAVVFAVLFSTVLCGQILAQDNGGGKHKQTGERHKSDVQKPEVIDMTVSGKITKEDRAGNKGQTITQYVLTDAQGNKVMLPSGTMRKHSKGDAGAAQPAAFTLSDYVDKDVTITGKGYQSTKNDVKVTRIVEIVKIEAAAPAAGAAAPAPAAPATPPAPAAQ